MMRHPLQDYLAASGDAVADFAGRVGTDGDAIERILAGAAADVPLARRIVDATDGAVALEDLCGAALADLAGRRTEATLEVGRLARALRETVKAELAADFPETLAAAAAETAVDAYEALARVTSRRGEARLSQALRPVLGEILRDSPASPEVRGRLPAVAAKAATLYFHALP